MTQPALARTCPEFRRLLSRRGFFQKSLLGGAALSLSNLLRLEAHAASTGKKVDRSKSVIILWMRGGPSQHDMWDPKPEAPVEIRGEFRAITTAVPGIQLTEMLPLSAQLMRKWSIVRSLSHRPEDGNVGHSDGDQLCFTGYPAAVGSPDVNVMPSCGAYTIKQKQTLDPSLPAYVMIPRNVPGTGAAWLGRSCEPFETRADPAADGPFEIRNLYRNGAVTAEQMRDRRQLLQGFDRLPLGESGKVLNRYQAQALEILQSGRCRDAFNLDSEPESLRERYGRMPAFDPQDPQRCGAPNWAYECSWPGGWWRRGSGW